MLFTKFEVLFPGIMAQIPMRLRQFTLAILVGIVASISSVKSADALWRIDEL